MDRKDRKGSWSLFMGFVLTAAVAFTGCGGGGGGGGTTTTTTTDTTTDSGGSGASLRVAERISVVDAAGSSGTGVAGLRIGKFRVPVPSTVDAAGTDWSNDVTQTFVHERSAEAFGIINEILCMMSQSQYDDMVNKGTYRAQIDMNQCKQDRDSASEAGQSSQNQSSGSTMPNYEDWTVNSYRADNTSPHTVKVWVHEKARHEGDHHEPAKVILVSVNITEGVSATNPYGIFTLNFKAHPLNPDGSLNANITMFKGYLSSYRNQAGKVLLDFIVDGGFDSEMFTEKVALDRAPDGKTGAGETFNSYSSTWGKGKEHFRFANNTSYFKRQDVFTNASTCLDRNSFNQTAWRYGLYDSNGARVTRNSGFPIKFNSYHGWVGYWGLWLPEGATVNDKDIVYRQEYTANALPTEVQYTVMIRGGKLKKHTQKLMTLADVKNIPLDYWDQGTNYRVVWDGAKFAVVAKQSQTDWMWQQCGGTVTCPASIDLTKLTWDMLNFWSQALGGSVQVKLNCPPAGGTTWPPVCNNTTSAGDASQVIFYAEDIVYPGDLGATTVTLSCYDEHNCLDPNAFATLTDTNTANDNPYFTNQITIPTGTISITDASIADWTVISALATDPAGDSTAAKTGGDITALYAANDANNLYIRLDLSAAANPTFGNGPAPNDGSYRFQIESNSTTYPFLGVGVAYANGQWQVGGNGSSFPAPNSLQNNPNLVGVTGGTIEIKIPLADIGNPTTFRRITAEANSCCSQPMGQPPTAWDVIDVLVKHDYTFDPTVNGMVLTSGATPVVLTGTITSQQYQWGVWSAPLFDPTTVDSATGKTYLQLLACDWDPNRTCGWKAWSALPVFYTWETGPAQWSRLTLLKDSSGNVPKFEAPLQVNYTYQKSGNTAADNKYCLDGAATCAKGAKFYLEYAGFGELHGIPGTCVDMDTGQPASCGPNTRWVAEFMIPEGAEVTYSSNGATITNYVKPLEVEQRMRKVAASSCSALAIATYDLPEMTLWSDPNIGTEPTTVPPLISDAPAVIGGVVQPGF